MQHLKLGLSAIQLAIVLVCSTASGGWAQSHIWSTSLEGREGNRVAIDATGNTVIAGRYDNSVLVAKFDATGKQLWRKLFTRGNLWGPRIALDSGGDIVITGGFTMTINFGGGVLVSAGSEDMYLAKLSGLDGGHIWSRRFGSEDLERGVGIAIDDDSNVIVTGQFDGTANFGGGNLTSAGNFDVLVAKYDAAGFHIWSKSFGSPTRDQSLDVTVDEHGNVIATGKFIGSGIDFGGGPLNSTGIYDVFLAKLDANGDHLWSKSYGSPTNDSGAAVAVNENGDVSITGDFSGSVSFGGDTLTAPGNMGEGDIFVAKYRADGSHVWSQRFGNEHSELGSEIAVDEAGNVVVTGSFYGTVDFGGGPIGAVEVDGFLAKYDSDGAHIWSRRLGGAGEDRAFGTA
ncbi:MAG: PQQ-binding-like beta-propeller repeat protein, partial [Candidatus Latescibacterota bacterium]